MATDTLIPGVAVITRRLRTKGRIVSVIRHALTRAVSAVIIDPGTGSADDYFVTSARNLRAA